MCEGGGGGGGGGGGDCHQGICCDPAAKYWNSCVGPPKSLLINTATRCQLSTVSIKTSIEPCMPEDSGAVRTV